MKLQPLSPMNKRGFTLTEVVVAGALLLTVLSGMASLMGLAGVMQLSTTVQSSTDQSAAKAMNRMTLEVREAKRVQIVAPHQFRVYYPVATTEGPFDRFQEDTSKFVEFVQADANGTPSASGRYLWRKTQLGNDRIIAEDMRSLSVSSPTPHTLMLTVHVWRDAGRRTGSTRLTNRVLYLRNN